jgi:Amiloride-sensitive sodium channel
MVVFCGISGAIYIIDNSFKAWASNPVITAVEQIPIERVPFPSITICKFFNQAPARGHLYGSVTDSITG